MPSDSADSSCGEIGMTLRRKTTTFALGALLVLQFVALAWNGYWNSPTIDEPGHLQASLCIYHWGRYEVYAVNPPLVRLITGLPMSLLGLTPAVTFEDLDPASRWEFAAGYELFESKSDQAMNGLRWSRWSLIPFILMGTSLIFFWAKSLWGEWGGIVAATIWAANPMILGHGALITPDVVPAVAGWWAIFQLRQWLIAPTWHRSYWLGLFLGVALIAKFTWIAILPPCFLAFAAVHFLLDRERRDSLLAIGGKITLAASVALLVVNVAYGFDKTGTALGSIPMVSDAWKANESLTAGRVPPRQYPSDRRPPAVNRWSGTMLGNIPVPVPALYLQGIDVQKRDLEPARKWQSYLLGEWRDHGWWYYYLVAALVKEPVGFLMILAISLLTLTRGGASILSPTNLSARLEIGLLLVPALAAWLLVSSNTGFNHHYRYLIVALPGLAIVCGASVHGEWLGSGYRCRSLIAALVLLLITEVICACPAWLSFTNFAARTARSADFYLSDSNVDWGQDLMRLRQWQLNHPSDLPLYLMVFTFIHPESIEISHTALPPKVFVAADGRDPWLRNKIDVDHFPDGFYAVSTCASQGRMITIIDDRGTWHQTFLPRNFYEHAKTVATIGGTLTIQEYRRQRTPER